MAGQVAYLVFDLESVAEGQLVSKLRYPGQGLAPQAAVRKYRDELLEKYESDFIPYTFQISGWSIWCCSMSPSFARM